MTQPKPLCALMQKTQPVTVLSPERRFWQRFRANRLGFFSLCLLLLMFALSLAAEFISNDRPLLLRYDGHWYVPVLQNLPDRMFTGDFDSPADYTDPLVAAAVNQPDNFVLFPPIRYGYKTINYHALASIPLPPSSENWLGTDTRGRDMLAQLIYGFRVSIVFGIALTAIGVVLGIMFGAVQGYFAGKVDLVGQRFQEIWGSMPELYLLIIFSAIFSPSLALLLILLSLFGWIGLADYVRAEFLRNRQLDYVRAARAMGLSHWQIIIKHLLPNSLTPVITFLPFRLSGAILALTSLDFLGLGVPPDTPSLGELLAQGKSRLDAWWIILPTFALLFVTLLLLTFTGEALRNALDPRHQKKKRARTKQVIAQKGEAS